MLAARLRTIIYLWKPCCIAIALAFRGVIFVIEEIFRYLAADHDDEYMMIDSTIVRTHQHSNSTLKKGGMDQAIGRLQGGLTTKIHAICDSVGNPIELDITLSQDDDITQTESPVENFAVDAFLVDRAYDTNKLIS